MFYLAVRQLPRLGTEMNSWGIGRQLTSQKFQFINIATPSLVTQAIIIRGSDVALAFLAILHETSVEI